MNEQRFTHNKDKLDGVIEKGTSDSVQSESAPIAGHKIHDHRLDLLYTNYLQELSSGIRRKYGDGPPEPDEIAQEAFRRMFEKDTTCIQNLKAFLWRTARNLVLEDKKKEKVRLKYDKDVQDTFFSQKDHNFSPENVIIVEQQLGKINEILLGIPEIKRRAFMLYRIEGLPLEAVAKKLGVSRRTVSKHISYVHTLVGALFIENTNE
ncbi:MAG: RNA polymerase sigma factor [Pseudomonadota bacterium]